MEHLVLHRLHTPGLLPTDVKSLGIYSYKRNPIKSVSDFWDSMSLSHINIPTSRLKGPPKFTNLQVMPGMRSNRSLRHWWKDSLIERHSWESRRTFPTQFSWMVSHIHPSKCLIKQKEYNQSSRNDNSF